MTLRAPARRRLTPAAVYGLAAMATSWLASCTRDRPAAVPGGGTPALGAPAPLPAVPPAPPVPLSRFAVPLDYDVTPVLAVVERAVPHTFGSLTQPHQVGTDTRKHVAYSAVRTPFAVSIDGPEVHLRTTLAYAARGYYRTPLGVTLGAGCGARDDPRKRPHAAVEIVSPLALAPDWHLRAHARLAQLAPASSGPADRCRVGVINMDVTDRVVDAARQALTQHLPDIDRKVAEVDLTPQATGWWRSLNRPIHLTDSVWLLLGPQQLREGRVGGAGHLLTLEAGLDAYPKIVTGPEPHVATPPLPPLAQGVGAPGFEVRLEGVVGYPTASRAVTAALRGRTVTEAGHSITVQRVTAAPADAGRLALTVRFTGDADGSLRLVGTPRLVAASGQLVVPDLDYDLATDSRLLAAAAWLGSDALRALFRERARVPLAPALERGRALLLSGLNRKVGDALTLSATVDSVAVRGVYVTAPGIVVRAGATGQARVSVRQRG